LIKFEAKDAWDDAKERIISDFDDKIYGIALYEASVEGFTLD